MAKGRGEPGGGDCVGDARAGGHEGIPVRVRRSEKKRVGGKSESEREGKREE